MSTEVEQQTVANSAATNEQSSTLVSNNDAQAPVETTSTSVNGNTNEHVGTPENGNVELDPSKDPIGWVKQQNKAVMHKINYNVLQWIHSLALDENETRQIPVRDAGFVTRGQFLDDLRDGFLLARLANTLNPGSVETIYANDAALDKNNQKSNVEAFLQFAKEKAGFEQSFELNSLLEKGKSGYETVFNTLFNLGLVAQEKFGQVGLDIAKMVEDSSSAVESNIVQNLVNQLKKTNPSSLRKSISSLFNFGQSSSQLADQTKANGEVDTQTANGKTNIEQSEKPAEEAQTSQETEKCVENQKPEQPIQASA